MSNFYRGKSPRGKNPLYRGVVVGLAVCFLLGGMNAFPQAGKAQKKQQELAKTAEEAKKAVTDALENIRAMLDDYNNLLSGTLKNPQSAFKKLGDRLERARKETGKIQKHLETVNKQAGDFFSAWEADLDKFTNEDLKQKSMDRLDAAKAKYQALGEVIGQAGEAFRPVLQNLNDQIMILGRDLSPGAIADLQGEAAALNEQFREVAEGVKAGIEEAKAGSEPME